MKHSVKTNPKQIPDWLKPIEDRRRSLGILKSDLCRTVGINRQTYTRYLNNSYVPNIVTYMDLVKAVGLKHLIIVGDIKL